MAQKSLQEELKNLSIREADYPNWRYLLAYNFPGYPSCITGMEMAFHNPRESGSAIVILFHPTWEHHQSDFKEYTLFFKADGTARFVIPDNCPFDCLKGFSGTWFEACKTLGNVLYKNYPESEMSEKFIAFVKK